MIGQNIGIAKFKYLLNYEMYWMTLNLLAAFQPTQSHDLVLTRSAFVYYLEMLKGKRESKVTNKQIIQINNISGDPEQFEASKAFQSAACLFSGANKF